MKTFKSTEPREIKAKFNCLCNESKKPILKGETIIYYPIGKAVYKTTTKQAYEFYNMKQDDLLNTF